jgi:hypothetical protein
MGEATDEIDYETAVVADQLLDWAPTVPVPVLFQAIAWAVRNIADASNAPLEEVLDLFCDEAGLDDVPESSDAPAPGELGPWPDKEVSAIARRIVDWSMGGPVGPTFIMLARATRLIFDIANPPVSLEDVLADFCRSAREVEWFDPDDEATLQ